MFKFNILIPKEWELYLRNIVKAEGTSLAGYVRSLILLDLKSRGLL